VALDWEQRYAAAKRLFGDAPSELLVKERQRLKTGQRALAVGDGEGRNGVWLAEQGLRVTALDLSPTAQRRAAALAAQRGVEVELVCTDFFHWSWPVARYDVITCIFVHLPPPQRRRLYEAMWTATRPGGLILIEAYAREQAGRCAVGPQDPALLADETELRHLFAAADILRLEPATTQIVSDGEHRGQGDVVHFSARRPAQPVSA
jgi:2-polyprenyl-3-methyl-5-hydroxy-6-metoxy-1,4-benzoquinol methylase